MLGPRSSRRPSPVNYAELIEDNVKKATKRRGKRKTLDNSSGCRNAEGMRTRWSEKHSKARMEVEESSQKTIDQEKGEGPRTESEECGNEEKTENRKRR